MAVISTVITRESNSGRGRHRSQAAILPLHLARQSDARAGTS